MLWLSSEKLNLTQQKQTCILQKYTTMQNKQKIEEEKTKSRFDRLLRSPAWKWNGPILKEVD